MPAGYRHLHMLAQQLTPAAERGRCSGGAYAGSACPSFRPYPRFRCR